MSIHKKIYTGEKSFQCMTCKNKFISKTDLARHKRIQNGEKPFRCDLCDKKFTFSSDLNQHNQRHHTGEKPLKYTFKTFSRISSSMSFT